MIDKQQLSELGWSNELIEEVSRGASAISGLDDPYIPDIGNEQVMVSTSMFDDSSPRACDHFVIN